MTADHSAASGGMIRGVLRPLSLTAVVFFTVSGGPYGLEPLLANVGLPWAIGLILVIPVLWCIPTILMVLELNGMMPRNGGYYQWVRTALGPGAGFLEGVWSWFYTFADLAIYPVLFTEYLAYIVPGAGEMRVPLCLAIVWFCVLLNLLGIVPVGRWSLVLSAGVLLPFGVLFGASLVSGEPHAVSTTASSLGRPAGYAIGVFTVMWNYLGWDNASTVAEEVEKPVRSYLISILAALVIIVAMYLLSVVAGGVSGIDLDLFAREGFPALGLHVSGWWLGAFLAVGGMASSLGLFLSTLLSVSRVPKAMADHALLPSALGHLSRTRAVPHLSIVTCGLIVSGMILWGFADLIIIDVTLYGAALLLEFVSLVVLRVRAPDAARPFRIPMGRSGVAALSLLPVGCWIAALLFVVTHTDIHAGAVVFAIGALLVGPAVLIFRRLRAR